MSHDLSAIISLGVKGKATPIRTSKAIQANLSKNANLVSIDIP